MDFWYLKQSKNISRFISFSSAIISFINSCRNFKLEFLCIVGVASVTGFGVSSVATSGVDYAARFVARSCVGISCQFFIENNLLLKLSNFFCCVK